MASANDDYIDQIARELMASQQKQYGPPIDLGQMPTDQAENSTMNAPGFHDRMGEMARLYQQMPQGRMGPEPMGRGPVFQEPGQRTMKPIRWR